MNTLNLSQERLFFLCNTIGPLLALATVLLMLFFPTPLTPFFALTLVIGIPTCIYLKKWGTIAAIFVLTLLIFFHIESFAKAPIWHLGMVMSILLTLYIAESSSGESEVLFETFSSSSPKVQNNTEPYKAELENLKIKHQNEVNLFQEKVAILSQDVQIEQEKNRAIQDLLETAEADFKEAKQIADLAQHEVFILKEKLESESVKDEHVLQELLEQRKEIFLLREQLQEAQSEGNQSKISSINSNDSESQHLQDLILKKDQDLFNLQFRLDSALEDIQEREKTLATIQAKEANDQQLKLEMEDKVSTLQNEKELLQFTIHQLQREVEQMHSLKQEKEILENSLKSLEDEIEQSRLSKESYQVEMTHRVEALINEKESLQSTIQKLQSQSEQAQVLKQEKERLESALMSMEKEVENALSTQETYQMEMQTRLNVFRQEKETLQTNISQLQQEILQVQSLKHEKERLEESLKQLEQELEKARSSRTEVQPVSDQNWMQENGLRRRAEGMYLQLKEQFNAKSAVLDETRRQLFHVQEDLLKLKKDWKEQEEFFPHPQVQSLTRHILKMQKGFDQKEKAYLSEIKDLHDVIGQISTQQR